MSSFGPCLTKTNSPIKYDTYIYGSGMFRRCQFGAAVSALEILAPDISVPGLSGARTFFLDSFFCSYVVSVCSSPLAQPEILFGGDQIEQRVNCINYICIHIYITIYIYIQVGRAHPTPLSSPCMTQYIYFCLQELFSLQIVSQEIPQFRCYNIE